MAEEEKKPNIKSKVLASHNASEKKPIGSHSVPDLKRRCNGICTLSFNITLFYIKQLAHIMSSPKMSASVVPLFCFLFST